MTYRLIILLILLSNIHIKAQTITPLDTDGDGILDGLDNCVNTSNSNQEDGDAVVLWQNVAQTGTIHSESS
uniref:hypothetical protein n=1 Tax=Flavobacterium sp. TaxID=239 RepID=UPI00404A5319